VDFYSAIQYVLFVVIVTILVKPLGGYLERVFSRQRTILDRFCRPVERLIYRITAVDPNVEMNGKEYATCFVLFGLIGTLLLYAILRMQQHLPWFFPQYHTTPLSPDLALNTAISFSTTTTWQAYAGENTMSYFSQMVALCAQNFLAGAAGLAVGVAFIRGLARQLSDTLGNFWGTPSAVSSRDSSECMATARNWLGRRGQTLKKFARIHASAAPHFERFFSILTVPLAGSQNGNHLERRSSSTAASSCLRSPSHRPSVGHGNRTTRS
jgi:Potassium-transporting ATPase A subunit